MWSKYLLPPCPPTSQRSLSTRGGGGRWTSQKHRLLFKHSGGGGPGGPPGLPAHPPTTGRYFDPFDPVGATLFGPKFGFSIEKHRKMRCTIIWTAAFGGWGCNITQGGGSTFWLKIGKAVPGHPPPWGVDLGLKEACCGALKSEHRL